MARSPLALSELRPERVCFIKHSALGDVVHALPVLAALRRHWPEAHFAWVVNRSLRSLVEGHPFIDEVIPFDRKRVRVSPDGIAESLRFLAGLWKKKFDLTIDLQGLLRSGVMTFATGARVRVGLADAREGSARFYTQTVEAPAEATHIVDRLAAIARAFGVEMERPEFVLAIGEIDRTWARKALEGVSGPRLMLNMGASRLEKRWPPEAFAAVAKKAAETLGAALIVIGSREDRPLVQEFAERLGPWPFVDLSGRTTLPRLAALAEQVDLVISGDTGPLHLAAATGTPVVGLYLSTDPEKTGPYGPAAIALRAVDGPGLKTLAPDRVWAAIQPRLELARRSCPAA